MNEKEIIERRINKSTEDDTLRILQYIGIMYSYKDISKKDYDFLRQLINDKCNTKRSNNGALKDIVKKALAEKSALEYIKVDVQDLFDEED